MKTRDLKQLEAVLLLRFQHRQKAFNSIVLQENRIRAEIGKLDQISNAANDAGHRTMQALGADVIWKAWVGRTKTALNSELAQTLAQKETLIARVRQDYGKLLAGRKLLADEREKTMDTKRKKLLEEIIDRQLQRAAQG